MIRKTVPAHAGCLSLAVLFGLLVLVPLFLADAMLTALAKLGLSPGASLWAILAILIGGVVNIPVWRIERRELLEAMPRGLFGLGPIWPGWVQRRSYTIIAVNVGGCVVPCLIAGYELVRLARYGPVAMVATAISVVINTVVCYWLARPVQNVGIAMQPLVPAVVAAACGLILAREHAPLIAFTAGVLGPLLGADLLHLRDVQRMNTGLASIGGAGTFDGIVLSGLVATLLA